MVKKTLTLATFAFLAAGLATFALGASSRRVSKAPAPYRIQLRGNATVLSKDQPVRRGSVVLFHRYPDGRLTGVPFEEVALVAVASDRPLMAGKAPVAAAAAEVALPLLPGDEVLLSPTGDVSATPYSPSAGAPSQAVVVPAPPSPSGSIQATQALEARVFPGDLPAPGQGAAGAMANGSPVYGAPGYGGGAAASGPVGMILNPTLQSNVASPAVISPTATSPTTPVGPNGFPATTGATPIGANGFPTAGATSGATPVGPNGFPAAGPATGTPSVGSNGFPATAPAAPVGSNGFPAPSTPR